MLEEAETVTLLDTWLVPFARAPLAADPSAPEGIPWDGPGGRTVALIRLSNYGHIRAMTHRAHGR